MVMSPDLVPVDSIEEELQEEEEDSFARKRIDSRLNNGFFETMMSQILKHYWMAGCRKVCLRHPCRD
jgi:hypothetical protein